MPRSLIQKSFPSHSLPSKARAISSSGQIAEASLDDLGRAASWIPACSRRQFARCLSFGSAMLLIPGAYAEELAKTPRLTEGPFYPDKLPIDTDNDLIIINDSVNPSLGEITHLSGRVLNTSGEPVRNAFVEIWQCDNQGAYLHAGTSNADQRDQHFQGYGRFLTDAKGRYYFRTIKPVAYPGRTPHIHFAISRKGERLLTTQMLIDGHQQNERDGVFRTLTDPAERKLVLAKFEPLPDSKLGEYTVNFDLVLGVTPDEDDRGQLRGISQPERSRRG